MHVAIQDESAAPKEYGPMWLETNGVEYTDVFTVPAGKRVERTLETSVGDGELEVVFDTVTSAPWHGGALTVTISIRRSRTCRCAGFLRRRIWSCAPQSAAEVRSPPSAWSTEMIGKGTRMWIWRGPNR